MAHVVEAAVKQIFGTRKLCPDDATDVLDLVECTDQGGNAVCESAYSMTKRDADAGKSTRKAQWNTIFELQWFNRFTVECIRAFSNSQHQFRVFEYYFNIIYG